MNRRSGGFVVLLCCVLAVPTVAMLMGYLPRVPSQEQLMPWIAVGGVLGLCNLVIRPILRLITLPLGCLSFGLFGFVIDVGLIYLSARFVQDFTMPGLTYAALTAGLINVVSVIAGGRRR